MTIKDDLHAAKTELQERIAHAIREFEKETGLLVTQCTPVIHTLRESGSDGWKATRAMLIGLKLSTNADDTGLRE
jgi:hypothetical protein